jgi:hypothetical protein
VFADVRQSIQSLGASLRSKPTSGFLNSGPPPRSVAPPSLRLTKGRVRANVSSLSPTTWCLCAPGVPVRRVARRGRSFCARAGINADLLGGPWQFCQCAATYCLTRVSVRLHCVIREPAGIHGETSPNAARWLRLDCCIANPIRIRVRQWKYGRCDAFRALVNSNHMSYPQLSAHSQKDILHAPGAAPQSY